MKVPLVQLRTPFSRAALPDDVWQAGSCPAQHLMQQGPTQWWHSPHLGDKAGNASSTVRAVPRAHQELAPTPLMSARVLLLASGSAGSCFISYAFEGHGQIISGVNTQADPCSPLCELWHEGSSAWAALLDQADVAGGYFSNSENQSLCPRGQIGKDRISFCQMMGSSFLKSNTGSSLGTQKLMKFLPCITFKLLQGERAGNNRTLGTSMLFKTSNPNPSLCQCPV